MEEINLNLGSPNLSVSGNNDGGTIKINIDDTPKKSVKEKITGKYISASTDPDQSKVLRHPKI